MRKPRAAERGQGIIEFAVIFPVFILLVFVMIDGGVLMGRYNQVNHAAQEGARLGATGASKQEIAAHVKDQSQDLGGLSLTCGGSERICVQHLDGPNGVPAGEVGSYVKVTVRYDYDLITPLGEGPFGATGFPDHFNVDACAIARLERPIDDINETEVPC